MSRLFIAIDLPEEVREKLLGLRVPIPGARWVPAGQLHLTLAFPGEVDEERQQRLVGMLERVKAPPFRIGFDRAGCFPGPGKPRVLWVGVKPEPKLCSLAERLRELLRACDIPQEERPFFPHVTLARLRQPAARECAPFLCQRIGRDCPTVSVEEFMLFESRLSSAGALHIPVRRFRLSGGGGESAGAA